MEKLGARAAIREMEITGILFMRKGEGGRVKTLLRIQRSESFTLPPSLFPPPLFHWGG
jgi:hypothetical protein